MDQDSHRLKIPPAPDVAREVAKWESKVSKLVDVPIGESTERMERNNPLLRKMVERAMAEETGADIAWINTGNVRDTMPQGTIWRAPCGIFCRSTITS